MLFLHFKTFTLRPCTIAYIHFSFQGGWKLRCRRRGWVYFNQHIQLFFIYSYFNLRCRIKASSLCDKTEWWSGHSLEFAYQWRWKLQDLFLCLEPAWAWSEFVCSRWSFFRGFSSLQNRHIIFWLYLKLKSNFAWLSIQPNCCISLFCCKKTHLSIVSQLQ